MSTATSGKGGYALRSKGVSPLPIQKPKPQKSRSGGKLLPGKVSCLQKTPKAMDPEVDMYDVRYWKNERMEKLALKLATAALSYLREQGHNFELVQVGVYELGKISNGVRFHQNFKAKRSDDPSAPVETFFSQLHFTRIHGSIENMTVESCVSLGASELLPEKRDNRGCYYCSKFVHHPVDGFKGLQAAVMPSYSDDGEQQ